MNRSLSHAKAAARPRASSRSPHDSRADLAAALAAWEGLRDLAQQLDGGPLDAVAQSLREACEAIEDAWRNYGR